MGAVGLDPLSGEEGTSVSRVRSAAAVTATGVSPLISIVCVIGAGA